MGLGNYSKMDIFPIEKMFPFVIREESVPHIADYIFQGLDQRDLLKCRLVSTDWKVFVDYQTSLWNKVTKNIAKQRGRTPLHEAAGAGHLDVCRLIMDNEQEKNPADNRGWTPLHEAAKRGQHKVCHLIMANVQDKNPANDFGATPLSLAKSFKSINHSETVKLFQKMLKIE